MKRYINLLKDNTIAVQKYPCAKVLAIVINIPHYDLAANVDYTATQLAKEWDIIKYDNHKHDFILTYKALENIYSLPYKPFIIDAAKEERGF